MDPVSRPGDVPPRHLERPPGDRYRDAPTLVRERPDLVRALALGLAVGCVVAASVALVRSVLDVTAGLLAIAVVGGWAVGAAVRRGAWDGTPHRGSAASELLGLALGSISWVAGLVLAWVVAMALLPGSERTLPERLTGTPFLDWLAPQAGLLDLVSLVLAAVLGWWGARSPGTAAT